MFIFGSGDAFATPFGAAAAGNPSPMWLGTLQDTSLDISNSQKELFGKGQFSVAIARAEGKISLKFKFAEMYVKLWNDLFFGNTVTTGSEIGVPNAELTVASNAITVVPPGSFAFARNLGVRNGLTGKQLTLVGSAPGLGQYTQVGALYTFNSGETATTMFVSYTYTSTAGFSSVVTNVAMGAQPKFDVTVINSQYVNLDNSKNVNFRFPAVISTKMGLPFKNVDFGMMDFECSAQADAGNRVMYINADE